MYKLLLDLMNVSRNEARKQKARKRRLKAVNKKLSNIV